MSNTFNEATQAKLSLKMMLSNYAWFRNILVAADNEGYSVQVMVDEVNDLSRKTVPTVHKGVSVLLMAGR